MFRRLRRKPTRGGALRALALAVVLAVPIVSGGTGAVLSVTSASTPYVVRHADEFAGGASWFVTGRTDYAQGFFHNSAGDSSGGVGGTSTVTRQVLHPDLHLAKADAPDPVVS